MCPAMVYPMKRLQSQRGNASEGPPGQAGPRDQDRQKIWGPLLSYVLNLPSELHLASLLGGKGSIVVAPSTVQPALGEGFLRWTK